MSEKLIQAMLERYIAIESENNRQLHTIRELMEKQLVTLVKLNAAMGYLNYISGGSNKLKDMYVEAALEEYEADMKKNLERLRQTPQLEEKEHG